MHRAGVSAWENLVSAKQAPGQAWSLLSLVSNTQRSHLDPKWLSASIISIIMHTGTETRQQIYCLTPVPSVHFSGTKTISCNLLVRLVMVQQLPVSDYKSRSLG